MSKNTLGNCQIVFDKDDTYRGKTTGPITGPGQFELHDFNKMKDEASSLKTGPKTWAVCYDDKNSFSGSHLNFGPNRNVPYLSEYIQSKDGADTTTWDNRIGAVQLYDSEPAGWQESEPGLNP